MRPLIIAVALVACPALAQSRWDHRGALGLLVSGGGELRNSLALGLAADNGFRTDLQVGGSYGLGVNWSLLVEGRASLGGALGLAFIAGARNHWGERLKTFFDLTLSLHVLPTATVGPRVAFGVQYELTQLIGVFALVGVQFGGGNGLRLVGEASAGFQFRTYLLE